MKTGEVKNTKKKWRTNNERPPSEKDGMLLPLLPFLNNNGYSPLDDISFRKTTNLSGFNKLLIIHF